MSKQTVVKYKLLRRPGVILIALIVIALTPRLISAATTYTYNRDWASGWNEGGTPEDWFLTNYGAWVNPYQSTWNRPLGSWDNWGRWWKSIYGTCTTKTYMPSSINTNQATHRARYYVVSGGAWYGPFVIDQAAWPGQWIPIGTFNCSSPSLYLYDDTDDGTSKLVHYDDTRWTY